MRVILYGEAEECQPAMDILQAFFCAGEDSIRRVSGCDALRQQTAEWNPNLIVILADRSNGMEGVYTARETRSDIPVFWFSDDEGFGMQSHRLECDYFAVKPFTLEKLKRALRRCRQMGTPVAGLQWEDNGAGYSLPYSAGR